MAKWFGAIGFAETKETRPGVWEEVITERQYYGDVLRNSVRFQSADQLNDNVNISNELSIVSDPFADTHIHSIAYVEFMGSRWKVSNVEFARPRLKLTIGGLYVGGEV